MSQLSSIFQVIGSTFLALVPVMIWGRIFYKKDPQSRHLTVIMFLSGAVAVVPILIYKSLWQYFPWINAFEFTNAYQNDLIGLQTIGLIPLSVILTFMIIGIIEEAAKYIAMRFGDNMDRSHIRDIDDAILYSILAALGFSFTENILYFYNIWHTQGVENLLYPFVFRSVFSTFAHILFSGIFGYYYGIAYFAKPILQEQMEQRKTIWERAICRILKIKTEHFFYQEKLLQGFLNAVILHAVFNIFLEMNWTLFIVPYIALGFIYLTYLLAQKENHKRYDLLYVDERNGK